MKQTVKAEKAKRAASVATERDDDHVDKMIADIVKLEPSSKTLGERLAEGITNFTGSLTFVWIHIVWFSLWIILDLPWWGFKPFDPFPFTFLTMIVSLEAIFLSAFILMAESKQGRLADQRARVNLEVDMIAEREITKLMELVVGIHQHLGIHRPADRELESMQKTTDIEHLAKVAQETAEAQNGSDSPGKKPPPPLRS
jgi:uncharacterized membrane protein